MGKYVNINFKQFEKLYESTYQAFGQDSPMLGDLQDMFSPEYYKFLHTGFNLIGDYLMSKANASSRVISISLTGSFLRAFMDYFKHIDFEDLKKYVVSGLKLEGYEREDVVNLIRRENNAGDCCAGDDLLLHMYIPEQHNLSGLPSDPIMHYEAEEFTTWFNYGYHNSPMGQEFLRCIFTSKNHMVNTLQDRYAEYARWGGDELSIDEIENIANQVWTK